MRNFIIGFILGITFVGIAWAAQGVVLQKGSGEEIGTAANPLIVQGV